MWKIENFEMMGFQIINPLKFYYMLKNSLSHEALNSTCSFSRKSTLVDLPEQPFFVMWSFIYQSMRKHLRNKNDTSCKFLWQTMAKLWLFFSQHSINKKDEEVLLFLQHSLKMAGFIGLVWWCDHFNRNWMVSKLVFIVFV